MKYKVIMEFEVEDIFSIALNNLDKLRMMNASYEIKSIKIEKLK